MRYHHPWERKITNIVPHDSVLRPILWNVFASNLVTKAKSALLNFGDDIKLREPLTQKKCRTNWMIFQTGVLRANREIA